MTTSIAWLTPFGPASDIGSFSRNLVRRLAAVAEATDTRTCVLVNENGASYWSDLPTIALRGQAVDQALLSAFDVCVYNIGNNRENHDHIHRLALRVPGVVIVRTARIVHREAAASPDMTWRSTITLSGLNNSDVKLQRSH